MATITPRTTKDGCTRWSVLIRLRGYPTEHKTFGTKTQAKRWAEKRQNEGEDDYAKSAGEFERFYARETELPRD